jgi:hypothetical protein
MPFPDARLIETPQGAELRAARRGALSGRLLRSIQRQLAGLRAPPRRLAPRYERALPVELGERPALSKQFPDAPAFRVHRFYIVEADHPRQRIRRTRRPAPLMQPFGEQLALFLGEWHIDHFVRFEFPPRVPALLHARKPLMTPPISVNALLLRGRLDAVVFAAALRTPPRRPSAIGDRAAARTPLSAGGAARADMLRCVGRCERGRGRPRPGAALVPTETERDFLRRRRG